MAEPNAPKTPERAPDEIVKDIVAEREGLKKSFDALGTEVAEAVEAAREQGRQRKEQARRAAPYAGGALAAAVLGAVLLRRRRRR